MIRNTTFDCQLEGDMLGNNQEDRVVLTVFRLHSSILSVPCDSRVDLVFVLRISWTDNGVDMRILDTTH